jgi:hypothetical protein
LSSLARPSDLASADLPIEIVTPPPGEYLLRFDLVSEGIDWFEVCGSEPLVRPLVVIA